MSRHPAWRWKGVDLCLWGTESLSLRGGSPRKEDVEIPEPKDKETPTAWDDFEDSRCESWSDFQLATFVHFLRVTTRAWRSDHEEVMFHGLVTESHQAKQTHVHKYSPALWSGTCQQ